jgi:branched-chain amino acid transport system ATP-binding protein
VALLELDQVTVRFGGVAALDGVSLTADAGQVVGLIGPNGAGKTTLLDVVTGLWPQPRGIVRFDGRDLAGSAPSRRGRAGIGRTFQRPGTFGSMTVRDNVLVASEIHQGLGGLLRRGNARARADELLERVGIAAHGELPAGALPAGAAHLLEIARALAAEPRLLLLDEPSSGMDEFEAGKLTGLLRQLAAEGRAVLVAAHDTGPLSGACDELHVLRLGAVVAAGTPAELHADLQELPR